MGSCSGLFRNLLTHCWARNWDHGNCSRRAGLGGGEEAIGFRLAAGEDSQVDRQPHCVPEPSNNAQDAATDVIDLVRRQAIANELAHIGVFADPADAQEGRGFGRDVLLVGIAQGFEPLSETVVGFKPDEDRLFNQKVQQVTPFNGWPCR